MTVLEGQFEKKTMSLSRIFEEKCGLDQAFFEGLLYTFPNTAIYVLLLEVA